MFSNKIISDCNVFRTKYFNNITVYIVLGIGINVISSPNINKYPTTCINNFNSLIDRDSVIHNFIEKFFINYEFILSKSFHRIINKFRKRLILLGKSINLQLDNDTQINGIFKTRYFCCQILFE